MNQSLGWPEVDDDGLEQVERWAQESVVDPAQDDDDPDDPTGVQTLNRRVGEIDLDEPIDDYDVEAALDDESDWSPEAGFPEPFGVLRLWVDEHNVISRCRMTPHWRTKLGRHTLADAFGRAFLLINNHQRASGGGLPAADRDLQAERRLSWDELARHHSTLHQLKAELAELPDDVEGSLVGGGSSGAGAKGRLRIIINPEGLLDEIVFDERWLVGARIKEISDGVVEAHRAAKAAFVPPEFEPSRREQIHQEMAHCRDQILALMRRGFV